MVLILLSLLLAYENFVCGYNFTLNNTFDDSKFVLKRVNDGHVPKYFDWRDKRMVSPVKNQRNCNACWAFSAVANIESLIKINYDREVTLSEQFLIDCDGGRVGCRSQSILETFARIVSKLGGVLLDNDYEPYEGKLDDCTWNGSPKPVPVIGFRRVPPYASAIKEFIYRYGPVSAGINSASMERYDGGIDEPTEDQCPSDSPNHAVLIVGFNLYVDPNDNTNTIPYWIIKNSWGKRWGDNGYYYLTMKGNACGITNDVSISIVK